MNCNSQNKIKVVENKIKAQDETEYFLGNWRFVEKRYTDGEEKRHIRYKSV